MRILGLIPARGGSKGIPNKNRKKLNGKPLLLYTIQAALNAKLLDRVVFSSEDETLRTLAKEAGAAVPFVRPERFAQDDSGSLEVVQHALTALSDQGDSFDAVCLLQVTTPFRTSEDIDQAIETFKSGNTDSLLSVIEVPHEYNPHWVFEVAHDGILQLATGEKKPIKRRQELPPAFIRDGSIYLTKTEVLLKGNSLYGDRIGYVQSNPARHVNIDTMEDWRRAEQLAKKLNL
ncbi:MAG: acylneuraminate cytidylyltransferase [Flavobacteriaceae bacterium]|nr:acylneuraminate cytidylyltransferase [Flavobacteriaceae bacterium]